MPNSVISQITLPSGTTYDIKDAKARSDIEDLRSITTGAMHYIGTSSTIIADGGTQNPTIDGTTKTMSSDDAGAVVIYGEKEYVWNGSKWQEFGSTGSIKALAFKDTASGYFTPSGSVSVSVSTTQNKTTTVSPASSGSATYTPSGSVSAPTISVKTAGSTTTVNSITAVGTLPSWTGTVSGETLTFSWSAGTLPEKGNDVSVKITDAEYESTAPEFTGDGVRLMTGNINVPSTYNASFNGTQGTVTVS